jgi:hypothetical protein
MWVSSTDDGSSRKKRKKTKEQSALSSAFFAFLRSSQLAHSAAKEADDPTFSRKAPPPRVGGCDVQAEPAFGPREYAPDEWGIGQFWWRDGQ